MKSSEIKVGQLFGVTWPVGPRKGTKNEYRVTSAAVPLPGVSNCYLLAVKDVKVGDAHVFFFLGDDVPDHWILIEDVVPSQSNSK